MSDDEEPDYMSDDFLAQCIPEDVRPGLKRSHADQRLHEVLKKKEEAKEKAAKEPKKTKKILEEEARQEGLEKSLDSSNRGFAMMQKMGFKTGDSLGKSNDGLLEPISIVVKANRGGLGRDAVLKQVEEAKSEFRRRKLEQWRRRQKDATMTSEEFRAKKSKERRLKQVDSDLYQSQKSCRQLDLAKSFDEPTEPWFWPFVECLSKIEDEDEVDDANLVRLQKAKDDEDDDSDSQDDDVTGHMTSDAQPDEEISADQPVNTDHEDDNPVPIEVDREPTEFEPEEMLSMLTGYLRSEHLYCLWCGITFSDQEDLTSNCPGSTREDHDD